MKHPLFNKFYDAIETDYKVDIEIVFILYI